MAHSDNNPVRRRSAGGDEDLEQIIARRDREISGLYLVLSGMGVSQDVSWTRAAELLNDRKQQPVEE